MSTTCFDATSTRRTAQITDVYCRPQSCPNRLNVRVARWRIYHEGRGPNVNSPISVKSSNPPARLEMYFYPFLSVGARPPTHARPTIEDHREILAGLPSSKISVLATGRVGMRRATDAWNWLISKLHLCYCVGDSLGFTVFHQTF